MMTAELPDPVYILRKEGETFHSLLFSKDVDNEQLLSGTEDGKILAWDLSTGRLVPHPPLSSGGSSCLCLRSVGALLVSQNKDGAVKFWTRDGRSWSLSHQLGLNYFGFCRLDASEALGGIVACPKEKGAVEVFDVVSSRKLREFRPAEDAKVGEAMALKFANKNEVPHLLAAHESGDVLTWDFRSPEVAGRCKVAGDDCPMTLDHDEARGRGVCGSSADRVVVFETDESATVSVRHAFRTRSEGTSCVRYRPDGKMFAAGSWDGRVRLFAAKTCRPVAVHDDHSTAVLDMAFSPWPVAAYGGRRILATSAKGGRIVLLDVDL